MHIFLIIICIYYHDHYVFSIIIIHFKIYKLYYFYMQKQKNHNFCSYFRAESFLSFHFKLGVINHCDLVRRVRIMKIIFGLSTFVS